MSLLDAFVLSVIGMVVVFLVLILLMGIVRLTGFIAEKSPAVADRLPSFLKKKTKKAATQNLDEIAQKATGNYGEMVLVGTEERDAAMIMAIVADTTGTPLYQLKFKSIKRLDSEGK